jgi:hypothetical protein
MQHLFHDRPLEERKKQQKVKKKLQAFSFLPLEILPLPY